MRRGHLEHRDAQPVPADLQRAVSGGVRGVGAVRRAADGRARPLPRPGAPVRDAGRGQRFRAARIVLDIGLHLELPIPAGTGFHEGERWTPALAREFLRAHTGPETDAMIAFEIDRYLGRPAQAIAYKLGERVWLEARETARRRDGAAFDLKAFHRDALDLGPMGLDLLRAELTRP
ncbi:DUF885 family protein [Actinomadura yumaensis]|uniref:DUF885 family protein n=1 Tax=Actinomadura yumaensis TaxID=111807 RepID=UPI003607FD2F